MARPPARILIVGAGPAGLRAAEMLAEAGCTPILVDEAPRAGGQIYRQPPRVPGFMRTASELYGASADRAQDLFVAFDRIRNRIDYRPGSLVYDLIDNRAIVAARRQERGDRVRRADPGDRRDGSHRARARLDPARRLYAGRRADRAEASGLRDRPAASRSSEPGRCCC